MTEIASLDPVIAAEPGSLPESLREFVDAVNDRIASSRDRELLVYVHGTKVSFYRSCVRAAELLHFAGRDLVGVLFDWPSHQNILAYLDGEDKARARRAAMPLEALLVFLSEHTTAERIHVLCYSAGGMVTSHGLSRIRRAFPDWDSDRLREHFRIGTVIFMAADVAIDEFLHEVPDIHDLADRIVVTMSDADGVLEMATVWMEHGGRIGMEGTWDSEEGREVARRLHRLELLDLSLAKEERGFDIGGHHYWYRHPWTSSDIILNVRTGLPAERRGLEPGAKERVWYLSPDYPERALEAVRRELSGQW